MATENRVTGKAVLAAGCELSGVSCSPSGCSGGGDLLCLKFFCFLKSNCSGSLNIGYAAEASIAGNPVKPICCNENFQSPGERLGVSGRGADPFHHLWITMIDERSLLRVERCDCRHVFWAKLEVEDREILSHPFLADGLGIATTPRCVSQHTITCANTLIILSANPAQQFVVENVVLAVGERSPRFDTDQDGPTAASSLNARMPSSSGHNQRRSPIVSSVAGKRVR